MSGHYLNQSRHQIQNSLSFDPAAQKQNAAALLTGRKVFPCIQEPLIHSAMVSGQSLGRNSPSSQMIHIGRIGANDMVRVSSRVARGNTYSPMAPPLLEGDWQPLPPAVIQHGRMIPVLKAEGKQDQRWQRLSEEDRRCRHRLMNLHHIPTSPPANPFAEHSRDSPRNDKSMPSWARGTTRLQLLSEPIFNRVASTDEKIARLVHRPAHPSEPVLQHASDPQNSQPRSI